MDAVFLDEVGGTAIVERVHKSLYDKLLSHPWLKDFFVGMERWHLEEQQTDFIADLFGGKPAIYCGRAPMRAHQHLFITEEVFMIRHDMLAKTLTEAGVSAEHKAQWLKMDLGMKAAIVKKTVDECEGRYRSEKVLVVPKPGSQAA
jgi:truncated hemoglobin YjbI